MEPQLNTDFSSQVKKTLGKLETNSKSIKRRRSLQIPDPTQNNNTQMRLKDSHTSEEYKEAVKTASSLQNLFSNAKKSDDF